MDWIEDKGAIWIKRISIFLLYVSMIQYGYTIFNDFKDGNFFEVTFNSLLIIFTHLISLLFFTLIVTSDKYDSIQRSIAMYGVSLVFMSYFNRLTVTLSGERLIEIAWIITLVPFVTFISIVILLGMLDPANKGYEPDGLDKLKMALRFGSIFLLLLLFGQHGYEILGEHKYDNWEFTVYYILLNVTAHFVSMAFFVTTGLSKDCTSRKVKMSLAGAVLSALSFDIGTMTMIMESLMTDSSFLLITCLPIFGIIVMLIHFPYV